MQRIVLISLLVLLSSLSIAQKGFLVQHVNLIDMRTDQIQPNMDVEIRGDRITRIGKNLTPSASTRRIDGKGKFLMPGLWDMHVHLRKFPETMMPAFLINGITGVREPGNGFLGGHIGNWKDSLNRLDRSWPELIAEAGNIIDGPSNDGNNGFLEVSTEDSARKAVRRLKKEGADFIKVYDRLSLKNYLALTDEANKLHLPIDGHPPLAVPLEVCLQSGQKCFEHIYNLHFRATKYADSIHRKFVDSPNYTYDLFFRLMHYGFNGYDTSSLIRICELFKRSNAWLCPTIVLSWTDLAAAQPDDRQREFFSDVPERVRKIFGVDVPDTLDYIQKTVFAKIFKREMDMLRIIHRMGVNILAGTDASPIHIGVLPGYSLHQEIELFVQAGFTPFEALKTATIDAAVFMNKQTDYGTVEVAKKADLLLLSANPLTDVSNSRKIDGLFHRGKYYDAAAINAIESQIPSM